MIDMIKRRQTKTAVIGKLKIGSKHPISVQSMTNCDVNDFKTTINQIKELEKVGCDLVRIAFPDIHSCQNIPNIKENIHIPMMADIHFNHLIALEAIKYNIDGIRINPGNIKKELHFREVLEAAQKKNIMIRVGINSGSLAKHILEKYKEPNFMAMVEETDRLISLIKESSYQNIVLSIKSSNVMDTIKANEIIAKKCDYPLHIGITEAGFGQAGIIKSAIGIGALLYKGIGDTIRVSLSGKPKNEVLVGHDILRAIGCRRIGINIIACPTCGRCQVNIQGIGKKIHQTLQDIRSPISIAIMGCVVNGPGEAKIADIGLAFHKKEGMLYKMGQLIGRYNIEQSVQKLIEEVRFMEKKIEK